MKSTKTHNISDRDLVRTDEGWQWADTRTVAHVFDFSTHEDDERIVRKDLHKSLSPRLVLVGRNAGSEFISFNWEKTDEDILGNKANHLLTEMWV